MAIDQKQGRHRANRAMPVCLLLVGQSEHHPHAVLVARLDNLGKGASGAAVQNMRLMLGLADK